MIIGLTIIRIMRIGDAVTGIMTDMIKCFNWAALRKKEIFTIPWKCTESLLIKVDSLELEIHFNIFFD